MARSLQSKGIEDLEAVKQRAMRQRALGRASREDCDWIVDKLDELIAFIVTMPEKDDKEMEPF